MTVLIFIACLLLVGATWLSPIESDPMIVMTSPDGRSLLITGRWSWTGDAPSVVVPRVNSVRVECDRQAGICAEFIAKLITPSDDSLGTISTTKLWLMKEVFRVVEWSESHLLARATPRAADIELRVAFKDAVVERVLRETAARGATGGESERVVRWLLR